MILAIDIGNTNIVIGCIDQEQIHFIERVATINTKTELEYAIDFKMVLTLYNIDPAAITGGIIASVVPQITAIVRIAAEKILHKKVQIVGPGLKTGLNILMDNPAQLGSDLVAGAVAGIAEYKVPLVFIDMGTATTIGIINDKKNYIGGMIVPGMQVALDSLTTRAAQLGGISLEAPKRLIGKNTIDCMRSGVIYSNAAILDGMIKRIEEELGQKVTAVATGGLAKMIVPYCKEEIILDEDLLMKGLWIIYKKNK